MPAPPPWHPQHQPNMLPWVPFGTSLIQLWPHHMNPTGVFIFHQLWSYSKYVILLHHPLNLLSGVWCIQAVSCSPLIQQYLPNSPSPLLSAGHVCHASLPWITGELTITNIYCNTKLHAENTTIEMHGHPLNSYSKGELTVLIAQSDSKWHQKCAIMDYGSTSTF